MFNVSGYRYPSNLVGGKALSTLGNVGHDTPNETMKIFVVI